MEGIKYLADNGTLVKVNIVMINDINSSHIMEVVKKVKKLGAFITNIMPLIPAPGSSFEHHPQTSMKDINAMRALCGKDINQMLHCRQCRADAVGLLSEDQSHRFSKSNESTPKVNSSCKFRVAVTSKYRKLVDLHYGHAEEFHIYEIDENGSNYIETRKTEKYCLEPDCDGKEDKKSAAIKAISDCDAVLTMRIGYDAQKRLTENGLFVVESCETVEDGLINSYRQLQVKKAV